MISYLKETAFTGALDDQEFGVPKRVIFTDPLESKEIFGMCQIKATKAYKRRRGAGRAENKFFAAGVEHAVTSKALPNATISVKVGNRKAANQVASGAKSQGVKTKIADEGDGSFVIKIGLAAAGAMLAAACFFGNSTPQGTQFEAENNNIQPVSRTSPLGSKQSLMGSHLPSTAKKVDVVDKSSSVKIKISDSDSEMNLNTIRR